MIREAGKVWSGAVLTPRNGQMFVGITGQWRVPALTVPSFSGDTAEGEIVCSSSTWIGLDGARSYPHSSLPQVGTIQRVVVRNGQPVAEYVAFHEWWCAGHYTPPNILTLMVRPGDLIECTLTVNTPTQVTFHIKNQTLGIPLPPNGIVVSAPNLPPEDASPLPAFQRLISGATAEWITERPSSPDITDPATGKRSVPYDLANYGMVVFENCIAAAARDPGCTSREDQMLDGAGLTLRDMVQIRQNRTELISRAELRGPQSVATFYRGT